MSPLPDALARQVLDRFGVEVSAVRALGNHGGFSGARLWRLKTDAEELCLRAWPSGGMTADRLTGIHALLRQAAATGLDFIPQPYVTTTETSWVERAGRLWDVTKWLPGEAGFRDFSGKRLTAACGALARLHRAWKPQTAVPRPCPAILRRLNVAKSWCELVESGWQPDYEARARFAPRSRVAELAQWSRRGWREVVSRIQKLIIELSPWAEVLVDVQPCLCDAREEHFLFTRDRVTGIVDFGSVKMDNVAVDLARMLGHSVRVDRFGLYPFLDRYSAIRKLSNTERALVPLLDRSGALLGLTNWLRWIYLDQRTFEDLDLVTRRIEVFVRRIEQWYE
jgi:Ser/Thr protein kinase RdoA (MazF antagonist)